MWKTKMAESGETDPSQLQTALTDARQRLATVC